jgi:hypothetical protein
MSLALTLALGSSRSVWIASSPMLRLYTAVGVVDFQQAAGLEVISIIGTSCT